MIKILYTPKVVNAVGYYDTTYNVSEDVQSIYLTININAYGQQMLREINFNKAQEIGNIYTLVLKDDEKNKFVFKSIKMFEYVQRGIGQYVSIVPPDIVVGKIVFEKNGDILIYLSLPADPAQGFNCIEVNTAERSSTSYIIENSLLYLQALENYSSKKTLIEQIDIYNSITYLESQVDAITKLLLSVIEPTAISSDLNDILQAADTHSVLNIKSKEKIAYELHTDKKKIRELQEAYYATKESAN